MTTKNGIEIRKLDRPWELLILPNRAQQQNGRYTRELTDEQIILCFILVALYMPRPEGKAVTRAATLEWAKDYITHWSVAPGKEGNLLTEALAGISPVTFDRYMNIAEQAKLWLSAELSMKFGEYLWHHLEDARKSFPPIGIYENDINAQWVAEALGQELSPVDREVIYASETMVIEKDTNIGRSNYSNTIVADEQNLRIRPDTPYERLKAWVLALFGLR